MKAERTIIKGICFVYETLGHMCDSPVRAHVSILIKPAQIIHFLDYQPCNIYSSTQEAITYPHEFYPGPQIKELQLVEIVSTGWWRKPGQQGACYLEMRDGPLQIAPTIYGGKTSSGDKSSRTLVYHYRILTYANAGFFSARICLQYHPKNPIYTSMYT